MERPAEAEFQLVTAAKTCWAGSYSRKLVAQAMSAKLLECCMLAALLTSILFVQLAAMLTQEWMVTIKDVAGITGAGIKWELYDVVCFLTSTYGSGAAPASSAKSVPLSVGHALHFDLDLGFAMAVSPSVLPATI
jgi:hypothetical protein